MISCESLDNPEAAHHNEAGSVYPRPRLVAHTFKHSLCLVPNLLIHMDDTYLRAAENLVDELNQLGARYAASVGGQ